MPDDICKNKSSIISYLSKAQVLVAFRNWANRVDVNALIKSALSLLRNMIEKATHRFSVSYGNGLPMLNGNFHRLEGPLIVVTGRPYNLYDERLNLKLGHNLAKIGMSSIPMDIIDAIVGEIYLRMHAKANQDLIKRLEHHGAETVIASFAEWINYVSYEGMRNARQKLSEKMMRGQLASLGTCMKELLSFGMDYYYQESQLKKIYRRARALIDLARDHKIVHLERRLQEQDTYSFDIGTETGLSIATALEFANHGYSGVVNVYPFTCMPGMTTSAILKPLMNDLGVPYLDVACDSSIQPGREAATRTFMYQAHQQQTKIKPGK